MLCNVRVVCSQCRVTLACRLLAVVLSALPSVTWFGRLVDNIRSIAGGFGIEIELESEMYLLYSELGRGS